MHRIWNINSRRSAARACTPAAPSRGDPCPPRRPQRCPRVSLPRLERSTRRARLVGFLFSAFQECGCPSQYKDVFEAPRGDLAVREPKDLAIHPAIHPAGVVSLITPLCAGPQRGLKYYFLVAVYPPWIAGKHIGAADAEDAPAPGLYQRFRPYNDIDCFHVISDHVCAALAGIPYDIITCGAVVLAKPICPDVAFLQGIIRLGSGRTFRTGTCRKEKGCGQYR